MTTPTAAHFPESFLFGAAVVIGGAGFIGSRLVADLRARDIPVVVLDDCSRNGPGGLVFVAGKLELIQSSTLDRAKIKTAVHRAAQMAVPTDTVSYSDARMERVAVFLLAACVANGDLNPSQYRLNASGPLVVTDVLGEINNDPEVLIEPALVFASSFAVYGDVPWGRCATERAEHHVRPLTGYGKSKRDAECAIRAAAAHAEYPHHVSLRFSNVVGASERVGDIVTADPSGGLAYNMIRQARVDISSRTRATKDGQAWRNFIDVRDVSAALMHAAVHAMSPNPIRVFNICANKPNPIVEFVSAAGVPFSQTDTSPMLGDVAYSHGSNEMFMLATEWVPAFTLQDSADAIAARRAVVRGAM